MSPGAGPLRYNAGVSSSRLALAALVVVNLVPLFGVLFLGWRLFDILALYWLENGVIGLFTILKMLTSDPAEAAMLAHVSKLFRIPFFAFHYGLFWAVHGLFLFALFGDGGGSFWSLSGFSVRDMPASALWRVGSEGGFGLAALSLLLSHGVSFVTNFLGRGEFRRLTPAELMFQPYGRVFVLHAVVLLGGVAVTLLGEPLLALLLLIALKLGLDLNAHLREHRLQEVAAVRVAAGSGAGRTGS